MDMFRVKSLAVALATTAILGSSAALAAEQPKAGSSAATTQPTAVTQDANKELGKLSADGRKAFQDVRLARLAIFDGQTDQAKKYVDEAKASITKAKTDDTAFTKDEASLKPPAGVSQRTATLGGSDKSMQGTAPTAWLPVDGGLTLGEDFVATPAKAAGVAKANDQLKKGDHKHAMETLKLSEINVTFVMEVAPLDKTISGIDTAAQLIDAGKYYEGNQALKVVEDGIRFDVADVNSGPAKASSSLDKAAPTVGSAKPANTPAPAAMPANK
jgi:YfdX protein